MDMKFFKEIIDYLKKNPALIVLIIIGSTLNLLISVLYGIDGCFKDQCGLIVGTNSGDSLMHIGISAISFKTFPFQTPFFAGGVMQGYHYLPNLLMYLISLTGIPIVTVFYQLTPIIYMILLLFVVTYFAKKINKSPLFVGLILFFIYFGSTLAEWTSFIRAGSFIANNDVMVPLMSGMTYLRSLHYAFSIILLLFVLIILKKKSLKLGDVIKLSIIIFLAFGTKFYGAIVISLFIGFDEIFRFILCRGKDWKPFIQHSFIYFLGAIFGVLIFLDPFSVALSSQNIFIFAPFSIVHHVVEEPRMLKLDNLILARYYLQEHGYSPRLLIIELYSTFLFMTYYAGTRILGLIYLLKQILTRKIDRFELTLLITSIVTTLISVLFIQTGDWFNTIQFYAYVTIIFGILSAQLLFELLNSKYLLLKITAILVIFLTLPSAVSQYQYLIRHKNIIRQSEVEASAFLKKQDEGTVFSLPANAKKRSYIPALTHKSEYISFANVLENWRIDSTERQNLISDPTLIDIDKIEAKYFFLLKYDDDFVRSYLQLWRNDNYKLIFQNKDVMIYEKIVNSK